MATQQAIPDKLDLKKTEKLEILWKDGRKSAYTLTYLRSMCPCAVCKESRQQQAESKSLLKILPGNYANPLTVVKAELVGNYALKIEWSDDHSTGIYSFEYLRLISPSTGE